MNGFGKTRRRWGGVILACVALAACDNADQMQSAEPSIGKVFVETDDGGWTGSLFKVAEQTYVTNQHVTGLEGARALQQFVRFRTAAGEVLDAPFTVVVEDRRRDMAVVRLARRTEAAPLAIYLGDMPPGMRIGAMGFPGANSDTAAVDQRTDLEAIYSSRGEINNVTMRDMSNPASSGRGQNYPPTEAIQHDSVFAGGSSGGPLLTLCGAVIGVNTQASTDAEDFRQSSSSNELAEFLRENNIPFTTDDRSCQPGAQLPTVLIALGVAIAGLGGAVGIMWLKFRPLLRQLRNAADRITHPTAAVTHIALTDGDTRIPLNFRAGKSRSYLVGRDTGSVDIRLDNEFVSGEHFEIKFDAGLQVRDLGSLNGTSVNGRANDGAWQTVQIGDTISAGQFDFIIEAV